MRYQCQAYRDERILARLSAAEVDRLRLAADDFLAQNAHCSKGPAPASSYGHSDLLSVVLWDGSVFTTNEAFQSSQISKDAYFAIEARDLNECLRIVSRYPLLTLGGIEIRPG